MGGYTPVCNSQEAVTLTITEPEPGPPWFLATLKKMAVRDALESVDDFPAEARFVMSGQSKTSPLGDNKRNVEFPAGAFIGLHDRFDTDELPQNIYPDVPIFWDLKARMGPEFALALAGYDRDGTAYPGWAGPALKAVGGAIGCYAGGISGCASGIEIGNKAAELLKKELDDGDDFYGALGVTCNQESNYCIGFGTGSDSNVNHYTMPMNDPDPNLEVDIEYQIIEAPRLKDIRVTLRDLKLIAGIAGNDDDWKKGGEDIWIRYRVAPIHLVEQELNTARSLPENAPINTFHMSWTNARPTGITIIGNNITNSGSNAPGFKGYGGGILAHDADNVRIQGNTLRNNGGPGIYASQIIGPVGSTHLQVSDNRIFDDPGAATPTTVGILIDAVCDYVMVTGNNAVGLPVPATIPATLPKLIIKDNFGF